MEDLLQSQGQKVAPVCRLTHIMWDKYGHLQVIDANEIQRVFLLIGGDNQK